MENNHRQKSMYLVFILIWLTYLFFSTFTHVYHFIAFTSMLIKFHFWFFCILDVLLKSMLQFIIKQLLKHASKFWGNMLHLNHLKSEHRILRLLFQILYTGLLTMLGHVKRIQTDRTKNSQRQTKIGKKCRITHVNDTPKDEYRGIRQLILDWTVFKHKPNANKAF